MTTLAQRSFSGGEIAPVLYGRVDTIKYQTGLRTCRNFYVMRHGGATNRPGTQFVQEVKDSTKLVRLIPFIFNNEQTYVLEFGDQYLRIIQDGSYLYEAAKTITGITQANPAVVTSTAHGYSNGDEVYISGVVGMPEINARSYKVAGVTANTFELQDMDGTDIDSSAFGAYASGGEAIKVYEISTPYDDDDLAELNFVQSADVVTLVHPSYQPRELARAGALSWSLVTISTAPGIAAPTGVTNDGAAGTTYRYVVTSLASETYEESLQSGVTNTSTDASATAVNISWNAVSGAAEYNVYKRKNGVYGLIGVAGGLTFEDTGIDPDVTQTPPQNRPLFGTSNNYPSAVTYYQQRLTFANTNNDPEKVWASRSGLFKNFSIRSPLQEDDAVTFSLAGRQVNEIRHLLDLGRLLMFTTSGEWAIEGDDTGILSPTGINPRQQSYNGSSTLRPIIVDNTVLYVQARGSIVRSLGFDLQVDGYRGDDLTIFSAHLVDGFSIVDWDYQQIPHSIVWCVRSDGVLIGLTYVREQQVLAWHRHDFDGGFVENVCVIPENNEDVVYVTVRRTINGRVTRYIERMASRKTQADVSDYKFLDSHLSYDGRNTTASHTMTLSGGTTWAYDETITLTSSTSFFAASDIGNQIHLTGSGGTIIRFTIEAYSSGTVVTGKPQKTVPAAMRSVAISDWSKAVDEIRGLWHLEGKNVSVFADGFVVANPYNPSYEIKTVTNGRVTFAKPYSVIHIGLPFISDIETLDVDTTQGEPLTDKKKLTTRLTLQVENTRGLWAGAKPPSSDASDALENLVEFKLRNDESYDEPTALKTEPIDVNLQGEWNSNGRIFLRQIDPIPATVLNIMPAGLYPFRGGG